MSEGKTVKIQVCPINNFGIFTCWLVFLQDLLLAATLVQEAMDGQRAKLKTEPRFVR